MALFLSERWWWNGVAGNARFITKRFREGAAATRESILRRVQIVLFEYVEKLRQGKLQRDNDRFVSQALSHSCLYVVSIFLWGEGF